MLKIHYLISVMNNSTQVTAGLINTAVANQKETAKQTFLMRFLLSGLIALFAFFCW